MFPSLLICILVFVVLLFVVISEAETSIGLDVSELCLSEDSLPNRGFRGNPPRNKDRKVYAGRFASNRENDVFLGDKKYQNIKKIDTARRISQTISNPTQKIPQSTDKPTIQEPKKPFHPYMNKVKVMAANNDKDEKKDKKEGLPNGIDGNHIPRFKSLTGLGILLISIFFIILGFFC